MNGDARPEQKQRGCSTPITGCAIGCVSLLAVAGSLALWIRLQVPRWLADAYLDPDQRFGPALAAIGDVDGDGREDIALGASTRDRVWILSSLNGTVVEQVEGPRDFGFALAAIEDADGDGKRDLAVGAPRSCEVRVLGSRDRRVLAHLQSAERGLFGHALAAAGDLDGNGVPEIAIGDPGTTPDGGVGPGSIQVSSLDGSERWKVGASPGTRGFGSRLVRLVGDELAVFEHHGAESITVVSLTTGATRVVEPDVWRAEQAPRSHERTTAESPEWRPHYRSLHGWLEVGDVDGDGRTDVAIVAGHAFDTVVALVLVSGANETELWRVDGSKGERFGRVLASPGDLDGDGVPDVVASDPGPFKGGGLPMLPLPREFAPRDPDPTRGGIVRAYSGRDGSVLWEVRGDAEWDWLGIDLLALGDVDGDGVSDVVAAGEHGFVEKAPFVRVISGRTGDTVWERDL